MLKFVRRDSFSDRIDEAVVDFDVEPTLPGIESTSQEPVFQVTWRAKGPHDISFCNAYVRALQAPVVKWIHYFVSRQSLISSSYVVCSGPSDL